MVEPVLSPAVLRHPRREQMPQVPGAVPIQRVGGVAAPGAALDGDREPRQVVPVPPVGGALVGGRRQVPALVAPEQLVLGVVAVPLAGGPVRLPRPVAGQIIAVSQRAQVRMALRRQLAQRVVAEGVDPALQIRLPQDPARVGLGGPYVSGEPFLVRLTQLLAASAKTEAGGTRPRPIKGMCRTSP